MALRKQNAGELACDLYGRPIQAATESAYQDASTPPNVSPVNTDGSGQLLLRTPANATYLHVYCGAVGLKFGAGTLAGGDGNGYCTGNAAEWIVLPVANVGEVLVATSDASVQQVQFFYEKL